MDDRAQDPGPGAGKLRVQVGQEEQAGQVKRFKAKTVAKKQQSTVSSEMVLATGPSLQASGSRDSHIDRFPTPAPALPGDGLAEEDRPPEFGGALGALIPTPPRG